MARKYDFFLWFLGISMKRRIFCQIKLLNSNSPSLLNTNTGTFSFSHPSEIQQKSSNRTNHLASVTTTTSKLQGSNESKQNMMIYEEKSVLIYLEVSMSQIHEWPWWPSCSFAPLAALRDADGEGLLVEAGAGVDAGLQGAARTLLASCRWGTLTLWVM